MESWHPLVVHFPLVLLPLSAGLDLCALVWKKPQWQGLSYGLLWLGTASSGAALLSGNAAAVPHRLDPQVAPLVSAHEDLASWATVLFLGLALSRLPLQLQDCLRGGRFALWLVAAGAGCVLLWMAGYTGGEMVYRHGVGVKIIP
ncbi:MAG: hypothetical protein FJY95_00065 [Candidatus Handelsmanbacteria bacterium]|nr:hypothetical protein [Candidatus Handelsmanbacteria bacterium]